MPHPIDNSEKDEKRQKKRDEIRAERRRRRDNGRGRGEFDSGIYGYIMLILLKEGPQTLEELEEKTAHMALHFRTPRSIRERQAAPEPHINVENSASQLVEQKRIMLNSEKRYELTETGKAQAENNARRLERGADILESQFLSPRAAARNTIFAYLFLSIIKLFGGFLSGSVGLIADGADTTVDTASAMIVWLSVRSKKEVAGTLTTIVLMFATAALLGYDSGNAIFENIEGRVGPLSNPYLIIAIESVSLVSLLIISFYQRFIGRRGRSLALITQSIDSKNSVYSAAAVIVGAVFSIGGIYWVDAVVGGIIAVRITIDAAGLLRDTLKYMRGKEPDFTKYRLPFEERFQQYRTDNMRDWALYVIQRHHSGTKQEIIAALEKDLVLKYYPPLFSELAIGGDQDFEMDFDGLVKPLIEKGYLHEEGGMFRVTEGGEAYLMKILGNRDLGQGKREP